MKVITYLEDAQEIIRNSCAALGNFDGVHRGHQELIKTCVEKAREKGLTPVVFTFLDHPMNAMSGRTVVKNIQTLEEKAESIEALGVEYMVAVPFTDDICKSSPEVFVRDILVSCLDIKEAVCGFNYSFGYKAEGSPEILRQLGEKYGFGVSVLDEFRIDGITVSSTYIRSLIDSGDMETYSKFTGRTYRIAGRVVQGRHFGRTMGFPTVNLSLSAEMALPKNGVYITRTLADGKLYASVTNVGNKPTVGIFDKNAETHIFGFDRDMYGRYVQVEFIKMLREEKKFDSFEQLSGQISRDCENARRYHEEAAK